MGFIEMEIYATILFISSFHLAYTLLLNDSTITYFSPTKQNTSNWSNDWTTRRKPIAKHEEEYLEQISHAPMLMGKSAVLTESAPVTINSNLLTPAEIRERITVTVMMIMNYSSKVENEISGLTFHKDRLSATTLELVAKQKKLHDQRLALSDELSNVTLEIEMLEKKLRTVEKLQLKALADMDKLSEGLRRIVSERVKWYCALSMTCLQGFYDGRMTREKAQRKIMKQRKDQYDKIARERVEDGKRFYRLDQRKPQIEAELTEVQKEEDQTRAKLLETTNLGEKIRGLMRDLGSLKRLVDYLHRELDVWQKMDREYHDEGLDVIYQPLRDISVYLNDGGLSADLKEWGIDLAVGTGSFKCDMSKEEPAPDDDVICKLAKRINPFTDIVLEKRKRRKRAVQ